MRIVLVALALVACHRDPAAQRAPAGPSNKVPEADYRTAATDELAFLPADADVVVGINFVELRRSQLWRAFKPQIDALGKRMQQELGGTCASNLNLTDTVDGVTLAFKTHDRDDGSGMFVIHGADVARTLDCGTAEVRRNGGQVKVDRGVTVTLSSSSEGTGTASIVIADSTLVIQLQRYADHDTLMRALDIGSPLRSSAAFMTLYNRRERGAAIWGMANGNAHLFAAFGPLRPRIVDGTIVVTDRVKVTGRIKAYTPDQAARIQGELDKTSRQAASFVDRFDARAVDDVVTVDIEVTEGQLRALLSLLGAVGVP